VYTFIIGAHSRNNAFSGKLVWQFLLHLQLIIPETTYANSLFYSILIYPVINSTIQFHVTGIGALVQRQRNVAAEKSRLMLIVQPYLKDIVCILRGCILTPRQQTPLVHADNNLIGRFALIQCFDYLLQRKR